jgi:hypothetical protein
MISFLACFIVVLFIAPSQAQDCNICGDGNSVQYPQGVVEFIYQGTKVKNSCERWQQVVQNVNAISDEFCRTEMLQYTKDVCRCTTAEGELLSDLTPPTIAPTPSSVFVEDPTSNGATITDGINKTDTNVVSKCEQTGGSASDCNDNAVNDTSSVEHKTFVRFIGVLAFATSLFVLY